MQTHTPPTPEAQGGPSFFTSGERQQIIRYVIEAPTGEGGCGISLDAALEANHLREEHADHWEEYKKVMEAERKKQEDQQKHDSEVARECDSSVTRAASPAACLARGQRCWVVL